MSRPASPAGYKVCGIAPSTPVMMLGGPYQHADANWKYWNYEDTTGSALIFIKMASLALGDEYWLYPASVPCGGAVNAGNAGVKQRVTVLQMALNTHGYGLNVDGTLGPKTCAAFYDYQLSVQGISSETFNGNTLVSLGMSSDDATILGYGCAPWYGGAPDVPAPGPGPGPDVPPTPPIVGPVASNSKKVLAAVLGAVGGGILGLAAKSAWYPRKSAWAAAGAGGALGLGAGLVIGVVALKEKSQMARIGRLRPRRSRTGMLVAEKSLDPLSDRLKYAGMGRGSVGLITAEGKRKYW